MIDMRDDGEPISRGQTDLEAVEADAFKNTLFAVALFTGVVLVNGILAILLIEFMQAIGWWGVSAPEHGEGNTTELPGRLRARLTFAGRRIGGEETAS